MTDYEDIRELLYKLEDRGMRVIPGTGATLIGHAPEIVPLAWLNHIFATVTEHKVHEFNERIDRKKTGFTYILKSGNRLSYESGYSI